MCFLFLNELWVIEICFCYELLKFGCRALIMLVCVANSTIFVQVENCSCILKEKESSWRTLHGDCFNLSRFLIDFWIAWKLIFDNQCYKALRCWISTLFDILVYYIVEIVYVYKGYFWHCIWHDKCCLSWQAFDFIWATFREKLVSHHWAVNEAASCVHMRPAGLKTVAWTEESHLIGHFVDVKLPKTADHWLARNRSAEFCLQRLGPISVLYSCWYIVLILWL